MADPNPPAFSASFPAPPPFWKYFTPPNVARVAEIRKTQRDGLGDEEDVDGTARMVKEEQDMEMATDTETAAHTSTTIGHLRGERGEDMAQLPLELLYLLPPTIESIRARTRGRGGVSVFGVVMDVDGDRNLGGNLGGGRRVGDGGGVEAGELGTDGRREVSRVIAGISCFVSVQG